MEIDFPKVVLFVLAVLPGYFALRARKSIAPLSLHKKGATEELAGFLVYSALAHLSPCRFSTLRVGGGGAVAALRTAVLPGRFASITIYGARTEGDLSSCIADPDLSAVVFFLWLGHRIRAGPADGLETIYADGRLARNQ